MEKHKENGAGLLKVHKQSARGNIRNSDHIRKKIPRGESDEPLKQVARRGSGLFMLGDVQESAGQALNGLLKLDLL